MVFDFLLTIMNASQKFNPKFTLTCSILGGAVMVGGLYCVLWAKRTEQIDVSKEQNAAPVQARQV
jgi:hypothetical protein